jgi:plastocyanin
MLLALVLCACSQNGNQQQTMDLASNPSVDQATPRDMAMVSTGPDLAMAPLGATVTLKDDFYMPNMIMINAGERVRWTWAAAATHGVNFVDPSIQDSPLLNASNTSFEYTFAAKGTYQINCLVHGAAMPMTVMVK